MRNILKIPNEKALRLLNLLGEQAAQEGGVVVALLWVLFTTLKGWPDFAVAVTVLLCAMAVASLGRNHHAINVAVVVIVAAVGSAQYYHIL